MLFEYIVLPLRLNMNTWYPNELGLVIIKLSLYKLVLISMPGLRKLMLFVKKFEHSIESPNVKVLLYSWQVKYQLNSKSPG